MSHTLARCSSSTTAFVLLYHPQAVSPRFLFLVNSAHSSSFLPMGQYCLRLPSTAYRGA